MASYIRVYASDLDCSGPNLFWSGPPAEALCASLEEIGQLDPVLVRSQGKSNTLLSGYRRVQALSRLGREILARCLPAEGGAVQDGLLYLHANLHRSLDDSLRVQALRYFQALLPSRELAERIAPLLQIQPRSGAWRRYTAWLHLPGAWDVHLHTGNVPLAAGSLLAGFELEDLDLLEPFFLDLKWSQGRSVQWLTFLRETALREGWSLEQTLVRCAALETLAADLSPQDTLHRLYVQARNLRYPKLTGLELDFAALRKKLLGRSRWELIPSGDFETKDVELRVRIRNVGEAKNAVQDLAETTNSPLWPELFAIGEGSSRKSPGLSNQKA